MNKFKVGDKVKVVKRIDSGDSYVGWVENMDKYVGDGEIYTVIESDYKDRVRLDKAVDFGYHWYFPNEVIELVSNADEEYSEEIRVGDSVVVVGTYFTKEAGLDPEPSPFSEDPAEVIEILGITGIAKLSTGEYYHLKDLEISEPNFGSGFKVGDIVKVTNKVEHERGWANSWVSCMDKCVGSTYVVEEVHPVFGIMLDMGDHLYFPPSSLELVTRPEYCQFKVGDRVVIKNEEILEEWGLPSDLNGKIATIRHLQLDDCPTAHLEGYGCYFFPLNCLSPYEGCLCPKPEEEALSESQDGSAHELFNRLFGEEEDASNKIRDVISKWGITISSDRDLGEFIVNEILARLEHYNTRQK